MQLRLKGERCQNQWDLKDNKWSNYSIKSRERLRFTRKLPGERNHCQHHYLETWRKFLVKTTMSSSVSLSIKIHQCCYSMSHFRQEKISWTSCADCMNDVSAISCGHKSNWAKLIISKLINCLCEQFEIQFKGITDCLSLVSFAPALAHCSELIHQCRVSVVCVHHPHSEKQMSIKN